MTLPQILVFLLIGLCRAQLLEPTSITSSYDKATTAHDQIHILIDSEPSMPDCAANGQVVLYNPINESFSCASRCPEVIHQFEFVLNPIVCMCSRNEHCDHLGATCGFPYYQVEKNENKFKTCVCNSETEVVDKDQLRCIPRVDLGARCEQDEQCAQAAICDAVSKICCYSPQMELDMNVVMSKPSCHKESQLYEPCTQNIECRHIPGVCKNGSCQCDEESSILVTKGVIQKCDCRSGYIRANRSEDCLKEDERLGELCNISQFQKFCDILNKKCHQLSDREGKTRDGYCRPRAISETGEELDTFFKGMELCQAKDQYDRLWEGQSDMLQWNKCPFGTNYASWYCRFDGIFNGSSPDFSKCHSQWIHGVLDLITKAPTDIAFDTALDIATEIMGHISSALDSQSPQNNFYGHEMIPLLIGMQDIVYKFKPAEKSQDNFKLADTILKTVAIMLEYETPWKGLSAQETSSSTFSLILHAMAIVPLLVAERGCFSSFENKSTCSLPFIFDNSELGQILIDGSPTIVIFPSTGSHVIGRDSYLKITLSEDQGNLWVASSLSNKYARKYSNQKFITKSGVFDQTYRINSDLLSFMTHTLQKVETVKDVKLSKPIELTFRHTEYAWGSDMLRINRDLHAGENPTAVLGSVHCVFWDARTGAWSSEGCDVIVETSTSYSTTCRCNHLSDMSIMMEFHEYIGASPVLLVITVAMITLIIIYLFVKILLLKKETTVSHSYLRHSFIIKNFGLILTLICYGLVFFLANKQYFLFDYQQCYRVGVLSHFVVLLTVLVFSMEILLGTLYFGQLQRLCFIYERAKTRPHFTVLVLPLSISFTITMSTLGVDAYNGWTLRAYGGEYCWLDGQFIHALFVPLWIFLSFNFFILSLVVRQYVQCVVHGQGTIPTLAGQDVPISEAKSFVKNGLLTNSLVLSTWLVGFFLLGPYSRESTIMSWVFAILLALQGILMENLLDKHSLIKRLKRRLIDCLTTFIFMLCGASKNYEVNAHSDGQSEVQQSSFISQEMTTMLPNNKLVPTLRKPSGIEEWKSNIGAGTLATLRMVEQNEGQQSLHASIKPLLDDVQESAVIQQRTSENKVNELSKMIHQPNYSLLHHVTKANIHEPVTHTSSANMEKKIYRPD